MLIGNKIDLERKVNIEEAKKFSKEHELKYLETSAKSDKNLRKNIACILVKIIKSKENKESDEETKEIIEIKKSYFRLNSDDHISSVNIKKFREKNCGC